MSERTFSVSIYVTIIIYPAHAIEMSLTDDTNPDATINALKRRVNTLEETVCRAKDRDISTTSPS